MARTKTGSKGAGYEYWSRRLNCNGAVGKFAKRIIHGQERVIAKELTRAELEAYYAAE